MRIYLASRMSRWLNGNHQINDAGLSAQARQEERERFARDDFADLMSADLCLSFTEEPRATNSRGGRHVEHGIALGAMKRAWVVGPRENVFHCLEDVRVFDTWDRCLHVLEQQRP